MGLNRLFMRKKAESGGGETSENVFIMTMGQQGSQYGYSRYNATIGIPRGQGGNSCYDVLLRWLA